MRHRTKLALAGLLSAMALTATACGGAGDAGSADQSGPDKDTADAADAAGSAETSGMAGTDHSQMGHGSEDATSGDATSGTQTQSGRYSDERFIDEMVPHHRSAVEMAEVARKNAEHREIRDLARNITSTQEAEVRELREIKEEEFGTSRVPAAMDMGRMEDMGMMMDPQSLANREPFDRAFIDAMIPHHESAVGMAGEARRKSGNPRIRKLAGEIVGAQEREISRMRAWREEWYPGS